MIAIWLRREVDGKTTFITVGNFIVENERVWCSDLRSVQKLIELYAENGIWDFHVLQSNAEDSLFEQNNIAFILFHQDFPYDVKRCISNFYAGENTIDDANWGVFKDALLIDSGEAVFCNSQIIDMENYVNESDELCLKWGDSGLRMKSGYGDGKYDIYTFAERINEGIYPMLIIVDYMVFSDDVVIE